MCVLICWFECERVYMCQYVGVVEDVCWWVGGGADGEDMHVCVWWTGWVCVCVGEACGGT